MKESINLGCLRKPAKIYEPPSILCNLFFHPHKLEKDGSYALLTKLITVFTSHIYLVCFFKHSHSLPPTATSLPKHLFLYRVDFSPCYNVFDLELLRAVLYEQ